MHRRIVPSLLILLFGGTLLAAQDEGTIASGPKKGEFLPKPFAAYNFSEPFKGRYHCLVCRYALRPAVLIFAREPEEGKEAALHGLLKRLKDATVEFKNDQLHVGVVFLSADAQSAATNPMETDPAKLVEEARKRDALYERLAKLAEEIKGVDVAVFANEGPTGYDINPKAEVTVLFYTRLKVVMNRAYAPGALRDEDADKIMAQIRETLEPAKKK